jgi:hypothetical protein
MHDALTIGIPVLAILFGILFNLRGLNKLEARMDGRVNGLEGRIERLQSDLTARLDPMQSDLSMLYKTLGEHGARIDIIEKKFSS